MTAPPLIVVDAANVVGSRPDGWWRDRPGATRRLLTELSQSALPIEFDIAFVVEGKARAGVDAGPVDGVDGVEVVHAKGSGDDAIANLVAEVVEAEPSRAITVVTADRGLRSRLAALPVELVGPQWLLARAAPEGRAAE